MYSFLHTATRRKGIKENYTYTSNLALGKNDGGILSTAKKPDAAGAHQSEEEDPSRRDGHLFKITLPGTVSLNRFFLFLFFYL